MQLYIFLGQHIIQSNSDVEQENKSKLGSKTHLKSHWKHDSYCDWLLEKERFQEMMRRKHVPRLHDEHKSTWLPFCD